VTRISPIDYFSVMDNPKNFEITNFYIGWTISTKTGLLSKRAHHVEFKKCPGGDI
jgi:hypothetical protein